MGRGPWRRPSEGEDGAGGPDVRVGEDGRVSDPREGVPDIPFRVGLRMVLDDVRLGS